MSSSSKLLDRLSNSGKARSGSKRPALSTIVTSRTLQTDSLVTTKTVIAGSALMDSPQDFRPLDRGSSGFWYGGRQRTTRSNSTDSTSSLPIALTVPSSDGSETASQLLKIVRRSSSGGIAPVPRGRQLFGQPQSRKATSKIPRVMSLPAASQPSGGASTVSAGPAQVSTLTSSTEAHNRSQIQGSDKVVDSVSTSAPNNDEGGTDGRYSRGAALVCLFLVASLSGIALSTTTNWIVNRLTNDPTELEDAALQWD